MRRDGRIALGRDDRWEGFDYEELRLTVLRYVCIIRPITEVEAVASQEGCVGATAARRNARG